MNDETSLAFLSQTNSLTAVKLTSVVSEKCWICRLIVLVSVARILLHRKRPVLLSSNISSYIMAEVNSDSSASSGENSGNSNSSDKSKASRKSKASWTENWTSKPKTGQDGGVLGARNAYYDHLMDRQSASKAVAIVVHTASKRGYVPLCTEFASLLRDNKRMELEINRLKFIINQMRKKGVCGNQSNQCYSSSSASESGSGESQGVKTKKPQTQPTASPVHKSSRTRENSLPSSSVSVEVCAAMDKNDPRQTRTDCSQEQNRLTIEELQKAKAQILKLENQVISLKAENQELKAQVKQSQMPSPKTDHSENIENRNNKSIRDKGRNSPEPLSTCMQPSLTAKETINTKADNLKQEEHNCCLKSCVKHRIKNGSRSLTVQRFYPKMPSDLMPSLVKEENTLHKIHPSYDKKPLDLKPKVLPKLGDFVTVQGEIKGYVNYVGPVKGESSNFVGIHLPSPVGNNDGTINGIKYFTCPPNYGAFVPLQDIKKVDPRASKPFQS